MKTNIYLTTATLLLMSLLLLYFVNIGYNYINQFKNPENVNNQELLTNSKSIIMKTENQKFHPNDFSVTKEDYLKWRSVRFGKDNPEIVTSNYHRWLIASREPAFLIKKHFGDNNFKANRDPIWCFDRFGQSENTDSAGNTYLIGGEHEDYYDPDFCIFNDVVKIAADGTTTLFLYPEDVFPPTDFHTATQVGQDIFIIGTLGYWQSRISGITNVYKLSLNDMSISKFETTGENPGWIFEHFADYDKEKNEIIVYGGKTYQGENLPFSNNFDTYGLNVENGNWRLIKKSFVTKWQFRRKNSRNSISLGAFYLYKLSEERKPDEETIVKQTEENKEYLRKSYEENEGIKLLYPSYEEYEAHILSSLINPPKPDYISIYGFQPNLQYLDELFAFPIEHEVIQGPLFGNVPGKNYTIKINGEQVLILIENSVISFIFSGNIDSDTIEQVLTHFNETLLKIGYPDIIYEKDDY